MDEKQQKALAVYLAVAVGIGWFGYTNFVVPQKNRAKSIEKDLKEMEERRASFQNAQAAMDEEEKKAEAVKAQLEGLLARFPAPKEFKGEQKQIRVYDTFLLSEQVSGAAHGLLLKPKDMLDTQSFFYQSAKIQEEDLSALGDTMQDPNNKAQLEAEKTKIFNYLKVDVPRFRYEVSGEFKPFLEFLASLEKQKTFFDISAIDLMQRGFPGSRIQANLVLSCLDMSDGLINPGGTAP